MGTESAGRPIAVSGAKKRARWPGCSVGLGYSTQIKLEEQPQRQVRSWLLLFLGGYMGDRAYAQVICSANDVAVFEELGFGEEKYWRGLPDGVSFLVDQEANYGHSSSLRELAARGYVFIAQHDAGGEYDAARLVSDGKAFSEVDAMVHEARPCVAVDANGLVDKKQLQAVRKYWRAVARAKRKLGFVDEET